MSWTDERIATLKQLWGAGLSASQIANRLGGLTRNAVIGKAHRLALTGRGAPRKDKPHPNRLVRRGKTPRPPKQTKTNARTSFAFGSVASVMPDEPAPLVHDEPALVSYAQLEAHHCRFIPGDPAGDRTMYCGCKALPGLPYCETHAKRATNATQSPLPPNLWRDIPRDTKISARYALALVRG